MQVSASGINLKSYISLIDAATDILVVSDHRDGIQSLPIVHMLKHTDGTVRSVRK